MKIHRNIEQGSVEWHNLRAGVITASEADNLVSPSGEVRKGAMPRTYLLRKLAEHWIGGALPSEANTFDMEQGRILESEARPAFELITGRTVEQVAFISTDDNRCGCSPDGLLDGEGLEIKCPGIVNHIRYQCAGEVPAEYAIQIQLSLWVTKFPRWHFMSYRRGMSPLILEVSPDAKIQAAISQAVESFNAVFDKEWAHLIRLNGEPKQRGLKPAPVMREDGRFDICN